MKSKCLIIFIFSILGVIICNSQARRPGGYIITLSGKTISGTVRFNLYKSHPKEIRFIPDSGGRETIYRPGEITGFYSPSTEEYYISQTVDINISSSDYHQLNSVGNQDTISRQTVFLKVVVSGRASLYYFTDSTSKSHYFIQIGAGQIKELNVYYFLDQHDGIKRFLVQDAYKTQLLNDLGDCQGIEEKISSTDYSEKSLSEVFDYYNQCHGIPSVYSQKKPFSKFFIHPGIIVGYASNLIAPETKSYSLVAPTRQFLIGISLEYRLKKFKDLLSLYGDIHYKYYYTGFEANGYSGFLDMNYIDLTYLLRIRIPFNKYSRLFAEAGCSSALMNLDIYDESVPGNMAIAIPYNTQAQFVSGLGISFLDHFCLEARFAFGHQPSEFGEYMFYTRSSYLLLGIQL